MLSMTGYGRATCETDGRQLTIELKSVNHRFLDLSFRMPRNLMFLEDDARRAIAGKLARGHVDVFMTYRNLRSDARTVQVLLAMRRREGASMAEDLGRKVDAIEEMTQKIEARYPETVEEYTRRLRASIEDLIGQNVDETRLLTEVAVMADRSAIAEETVRLHSHIQQLRETFQRQEPIGRRLDFLVQELNREVNTISSKSQDVPITRLAVECKAEIEKLREQLQNVE